MGKKRVWIEGMMCQNCVRHVKKALESVAGVSSVEVDLEGKAATVTLSGDVGDDALSKAVVDAGYDVTGTEVA
ncbi:MAG: heavy-metal-associated domain-containing protein [Synergistaceae bacterium]|nr:heavy-metal-associated domain-containing protein [Synergistaceae bacterium]